MKSIRHLLLLIMVLSLPVHAYELATHGRLTYEAYKRSMLKPDSDLLKDLSIKDIATFGTSYYDISGDQVAQREKNDFEQSAKRMPEEVDPISLPGWLLRGAIREDDVLFPDNGQPVDDPYNSNDVVRDNRVLHHFYDPVNDQGLSRWIPLSWLGVKKSPNWAIGSEDAISNQNSPESNRRNHFTVFDAREALYRALTGKGRNASGDEFDAALTKAERDKYWATLFRALGDIVHLVEDMAQPQHTRNDMHSGVPGFGHESVYEKYIDCRATGGPVEGIDNYQDYYINACGSLTYTGYATPVFTKYSDYFSTRDGSGKGLADYSNRNFFTAGTNLGNNNYSSPPNDRGQYTEERIDSLVFLRGNVTDTQAGGTANIRMTTVSAFDFFLGTYHAYSLNAYSCDDMADLLIPRAVAYSAGFIDYFFRGRIEAKSARHMDTTERSLT
jgi:hypothetical protein